MEKAKSNKATEMEQEKTTKPENLGNENEAETNIPAPQEQTDNQELTAAEEPTTETEAETKEAPVSEETEAPEQDIVQPENKESDEPSEEESDENQTKSTSETVEKNDFLKFIEVDFNKYNEKELLLSLKELIQIPSVLEAKEYIEKVQAAFYSQHNKAKETALEAFLAETKEDEEPAKPEDFVFRSENEEEFRTLLAKYKNIKADYNKSLENEKEKNLAIKKQVIEDIQNLINGTESLSETFKEFQTLQDRWKHTGEVPLSQKNELWKSYYYNVEKFYDYIRINKELRDLDFKKNKKLKDQLIEQAKGLLSEKSLKKAFQSLQDLHEKWKETGPVRRELREEMWQEFKNISSEIRKKHQEFFLEQKNQQKENLEKKENICERAEQVLANFPESTKGLNKAAEKIKDLQTEWKTIGFAPRKHNQKVYERFKTACDSFFSKRREVLQSQKEFLKLNLQKKQELCEQAEAVMNSEDWSATSEYLINLQKLWKSVGPVPYNISEKIWTRFRTACDHFFARRSGKLVVDTPEQEENLAKKQELIDRLSGLELSDDPKVNLDLLRQYQKDFHEIGHVPFAKKDEIATQFKELIESKFDKVDISDEEKALFSYATKYEHMAQERNGMNKVIYERQRLSNKIKQVENNLVVWENNIGFFSNSKNTEKLVADVNKNIEEGKEQLKKLYQKLRILDKLI